MSYTIAETGKVLTETQFGITMPADYSFQTVNDFIHGIHAQYEDLEALCLSMASHIDKMSRGEFMSECRYNGPCDYRCNDLPGEDEKQRLILGLNRQIEIMESNAAYLHKLYPELDHHSELMGAAKMTQDWIDNIDE